MDKLQISQIIKELISQGYPEPIIGGTCSLFLQGFDIEPGDIDLYYSINKEDFLNQIHHRGCPRFPISIDWNFYPNLDLRFQEIEIEGVKLRVQKIEDVLDYKLEGLEEDYFPDFKRNKHLKFFKELISDHRVSPKLRLRINQILNIMPKYRITFIGINRNVSHYSIEAENKNAAKDKFQKLNPDLEVVKVEKENDGLYDQLVGLKDQLFDAPDEVKIAFNNVVGWFDSKSEYWILKVMTRGGGYVVKSSEWCKSYFNKEPKLGDKPTAYTTYRGEYDLWQFDIRKGPFKSLEDANEECKKLNKES